MLNDFSFTKCPNVWMDELKFSLGLSPSCRDVMDTILRYTTGFHRPGHVLASSFLAECCKRAERTVRTAISRLKELGLITVEQTIHEGRWTKFISLTEAVFYSEQRPRLSAQPVKAAASVQAAAPASEAPAPQPVDPDLLKKLVAQGVQTLAAERLLRENPPGVVVTALANLDKHKDVLNPAGWLYTEIKRGGYQVIEKLTPDQKVKKKHAKIADLRMREEAEVQQKRADEQFAWERAMECYRQMGPAEQSQLRERARKNAGQVPTGTTMDCRILRAMVLELVVKEHLLVRS